MTQNLNIAIIQGDLKWEDPEANRTYFTEKIKDLGKHVDLIVLPEMFTTGFSMNAKKLAEPSESLSLDWMREMAASKDAAITGSLIISEDGQFYNRLFFVYPDGSYKTYDKRHTFTLAREDETYTAGTRRLITEFKGWKICPLICYDLRFPVWSRNTEDYDLLIYVANWPEKRVNAWDALLKARAIENMSYCIGVNRIGKDGDGYVYNGHSSVFDPLGKELTPPECSEELIGVYTLDFEYLKETRSSLKFLQDRDRFSLDV